MNEKYGDINRLKFTAGNFAAAITSSLSHGHGSKLTVFRTGNSVIISFEVVKDSDGHDTPDGYQNSPPGLSPDAINGRLSTGNEYIFVSLMIVGIGLVGYDFYNMIKGKKQTSVEDDWGMPSPAPAAPGLPTYRALRLAGAKHGVAG